MDLDQNLNNYDNAVARQNCARSGLPMPSSNSTAKKWRLSLLTVKVCMKRANQLLPSTRRIRSKKNKHDVTNTGDQKTGRQRCTSVRT